MDKKSKCQLYLITPARFDLNWFSKRLNIALDAGPVACLQLRLKNVEDNAIKLAAETLLPETTATCGEGANIGAVVQLWGQVAEQICQYADDNACDLIVLGTRGQSSFSKLLLGSVSTQVTSHAHCPVTLVR